MGIELNNDQIYCIYQLEHWWSSSTNQLFQISGSSGTGKTTVVRYLIEKLGLTNDQVLFVAFMGKAASQLARNGLPAKTIHSTIYDYKKIFDRDENGKIIIKPNGKAKTKNVFELKSHISKKIKLIVVDEGSMVDEKTSIDLMSFGLPIIVLGDLNQLPPVFGKSYFLREPDVILRQIMRQKEGDPIVWLAHQVLENHPLRPGVYGNSAVIRRSDINELQFRKADIILSGTNRLRFNVNNYCREELKRIKDLDMPHIGEKIICRKNNWSKSIDDDVYMTNGTTGFVDYVYKNTFNGKSLSIDFKPDFSKHCYRDVTFDYNHMYAIPGQEDIDDPKNQFNYLLDKIEYAYAITVHSSQGSEWDNVLYLKEDFMHDPEDKKKLDYTAITRAKNGATIVI